MDISFQIRWPEMCRLIRCSLLGLGSLLGGPVYLQRDYANLHRRASRAGILSYSNPKGHLSVSKGEES